MNFGIFIDNVGDHEVSAAAFKTANYASSSPSYGDVSLFYQDIGKKPEKTNFGMFNSTDLWYFSGSLVVTFLDGLKFAVNTVNKKDVYYYFGLEEKNDLFGLLSALSDSNVRVIANSVENAEYIKRKTGRLPFAICTDLADVSEMIASGREKKK